jgi:hypothetical protein
LGVGGERPKGRGIVAAAERCAAAGAGAGAAGRRLNGGAAVRADTLSASACAHGICTALKRPAAGRSKYVRHKNIHRIAYRAMDVRCERTLA